MTYNIHVWQKLAVYSASLGNKQIIVSNSVVTYAALTDVNIPKQLQNIGQSSLLPVFGVRVSITFHLMFVQFGLGC